MKSNVRNHFFAASAILIMQFVISNSAVAQSSANINSSSPLTQLYDCAKISNDTERLHCYDAQVADLKGKEERSEVVAIDQQKMSEIRRDAFGFNLPSLPRVLFPHGHNNAPLDSRGREKFENVDSQNMRVASIGRFEGKMSFTMENGQKWQFIESEEAYIPRDPPFEVHIESASLGSYLLNIVGQRRGHRVRRVQ